MKWFWYIVCCLPFCVFSETYYGQFKQDQYVNENFFKNKKEGFFVDIGAYDGVTGSNSHFFEKTLGWKGICVEPNPMMFEKLTQNRSAIKIKGCVGAGGKREFLQIIGVDEQLSGLLEKFDPRHKELIDRIAPQYGDRHNIILVDCYPLMDILKQHGITHIDYLSLDTEGGELDILKSIDFNKIHIEVIDVENNYNQKEFKEFLTEKGYRLDAKLGVDEIYVKLK